MAAGASSSESLSKTFLRTEGATENMKDGDVVEVEISDIGVLRNKVVWQR